MSMTCLLLVAELAADASIQGGIRSFGVDWLHLGSQIVSFAIVCVLVYKFAYHRVRLVLQQRRRRIADELAKADAIEAELRDTVSQRQEVLQKANVQAAQLIEEARKAAERVQKLERQKAVSLAGQVLAKAREEARQHHARMLAELKGEVVRVVVQTTATVTGQVLTAEDQHRLAGDAVKVISG